MRSWRAIEIEKALIGTGSPFSIFGGWGHEMPGRRLTRPRQTRVVREKR